MALPAQDLRNLAVGAGGNVDVQNIPPTRSVRFITREHVKNRPTASRFDVFSAPYAYGSVYYSDSRSAFFGVFLMIQLNANHAMLTSVTALRTALLLGQPGAKELRDAV